MLSMSPRVAEHSSERVDLRAVLVTAALRGLAMFHVKHGTKGAPKVCGSSAGVATAGPPMWAQPIDAGVEALPVVRGPPGRWPGGSRVAGCRRACGRSRARGGRIWWVLDMVPAPGRLDPRRALGRVALPRGTGCRLFPVPALPCVRVWSGLGRTHDGSTALLALQRPPLSRSAHGAVGPSRPSLSSRRPACRL
jgi:hypothetical protein